jgi:hypothetical protein
MVAKKTLTKVRPAEETEAEHALATVPDASLATSYVNRKIDGVLDFEIFKFAHEQKVNVLIEGPTGPGKTTAVMAYAAKNEYPFYAIPSNVGVEPSQLFGKFIPDGEGGFEWQDGPVTDLVRHGGVLLINEVNFMPARVATVLFGLLDKRREITLLDHKAEVIRAHDNLLVVADMNPDYSGTHPLNQAFRNRFAIQLSWGYEAAVEKKLVSSTNLLDFAKALRRDVEKGTLFTPISTNMLMEFEKLAQFDFKFACGNFVNHFTVDERPAVKMVLDTFGDNIKTDLFGKPEPIVVTDSDGKAWTQPELDALREANLTNPDYVDPELGKYGEDFVWEGEEEDDEDEETQDNDATF